MNYVRTELIRHQQVISRAVDALAFIQNNRERLESLNLPFTIYFSDVDFDNLERLDVLRVLKAFPGKWNKSPNYNGSGINYCLEGRVDGFAIRCYNGEPPPSCKIEEVTEYKLVPEHVEKVVTKKVVCPQSVEAHFEPELGEQKIL